MATSVKTAPNTHLDRQADDLQCVYGAALETQADEESRDLQAGQVVRLQAGQVVRVLSSRAVYSRS